MQKPNLKNCTKKIQDYIEYLELQNENLNSKIKKFIDKQIETNVYQSPYLSNDKIYIDDVYPVSFKIGQNKIDVRIQDNSELYISTDKLISVHPRAWNVIVARANERE